MTTARAYPEHAVAPAARRRSAGASFWTTVGLSWVVVWLIIQTPVAVVAFQYGNLDPAAARALLLLKDAAIAALLVVLLVRHYRELRLAWFDWLALAYAAAVVVYAAIPWALGSQLPLMAVLASARIFLMPVELYAVGRLAVLAGARTDVIVDVFLGAAAVAAAITTLAYLVLPASFWETTYDLPTFIREVQGLPGARSLWDISLLGHYGVGETGGFARAVGPFTHPVGTGHFFVLPLLLAVARSMSSVSRLRPGRSALEVAIVLALALAVITPISRGSWGAAVIGVLLCGVLMHRLKPAVLGVATAALFIVLVPPFSLSVSSALSMEDSSVVGHAEAVEEGVDTVAENPLGLGVGQADHLGSAFGGDAATGVGENLYLSTLVTVGPIGLAALVGWMIGIGLALKAGIRATDWRRTAVLAALVGYAASAMTASALMRFTTSAAFWLVVGLLVASAVSTASWRPVWRGRRDPEAR